MCPLGPCALGSGISGDSEVWQVPGVASSLPFSLSVSSVDALRGCGTHPPPPARFLHIAVQESRAEE